MKKIAYILLGIIMISTFIYFHREKTDQREELVIYASLMEEQALISAKEFERETGIKTKFIRMSSGEILERIRNEKDNAKASVWYGGTADTFIDAYQEGLIEPYISKNSKYIPSRFKSEDGIWTGVYAGVLGFVINEDWFKENGLEPPKTWDDLLRPEFEGKIVLPDPRTSGTAYTIISTIIQMKGEKEGFEYLKKLDRQVVKYTKSGFSPGVVVGMDEAAIGVTFLNNVIRYEKEGYKNLDMILPEDGTGYEIGSVALLKNSPQTSYGKEFIDWALTKRAQELGNEVGSYQIFTNVKANSSMESKLKNLNIIEYDFVWAGKNRKRLIKKFLEGNGDAN